MKNFLFPASFRLVGWLLFVVGVVAIVLWQTEVITPWGVGETITIDAGVICTVVGALFIVCSKEPREDEMTRAIRLSALLNSLYAYIAILIAGTIFINGVPYLWFIALNMVLFPIIFVIIFRVAMSRYYKQNEDEE